MIVGKIGSAIAKALSELGVEGVAPILEHPSEFQNGDYSTNVALAAAKAAKKNPKALADELVAKLMEDGLPAQAGVERIEVAGPGFINFYLTRSFFAHSVADIVAIGKDWGKGGSLKSEKIIFEYTQPNPFKEMHIGHLVNNIVGETVSRLAEFSGALVKRATYHGDIGLHVAKALWGIQRGRLDISDVKAQGRGYAAGSKAYEEGADAKQEIEQINKELYAGTSPLMHLYEQGRTVALEHFKSIYERLGSRFDFNLLESEAGRAGTPLVRAHLADNIFEESDGAVIFRGEQYGLHTRVFINSQGLPTYEAKDLALADIKLGLFPYTRSIVVVDVEQSPYFTVVEKAIELIHSHLVGKVSHVPHGRMRLPTGRISSRLGGNLGAEQLINEIQALALEKMKDREFGDDRASVADQIAIAAIKYQVLKQGTGKHIVYDPEKSLSFEGDSGPYLQYSHTRAVSVLAKAKAEGVAASAALAPDNSTDLERVLYRFPEVVERATAEYEPHYVTTYLTELAGMFNSWYAVGKIVDAADPHSPYKVALTQAFATTMQNGLWLLGIKAPAKM